MATIILCGQAGSGKDTVASILSNKFDGISIGQADPLKWMAGKLFPFNHEQLFGPSECRNYIDPELKGFNCLKRGESEAKDWCKAFFPDRSLEAWGALQICNQTLMAFSEKRNGLSPRVVLQTLGTEWGRTLDKNVWVNYACNQAEILMSTGVGYSRELGICFQEGVNSPAIKPYSHVIVTDGRFRNEIEAVKSRGGLAIKVTRPDLTLSLAAAKAGVEGHDSEEDLNRIEDVLFNSHVINDSTKANLYSSAIRAFQSATGSKEE